MTDELLQRLDRFTVDGEPDLAALQTRAARRGVRRRALLGASTVAGVVVAAVGLTSWLPSEPTFVPFVGEDEIAPDAVPDAAYRCGPVTFTPAQLADAPLAVSAGSSIPDGAVELPVIVDDMGTPFSATPADGWALLSRDADELQLLRRLEPGDGSDGTVQRYEGYSAFPLDTGTWHYGAQQECEPRLDLDAVAEPGDGPLGEADLSLRTVPSPSDTVLELHVLERECASGQSAEGRIDVVDVAYTDTEVRLLVGVTPIGGNCPSNPQTPFDLELGEPLGDRVVVDAATGQPLELTSDEFAPERQQVDVDALVERALSWQPPADYVLEVELLCVACSPQLFTVTVEAGQRVATVPVEDPDASFDVADVPTWTELLDVLRAAWGSDAVLDLQLAEDGRILSVELEEPFAPTDATGWALYPDAG